MPTVAATCKLGGRLMGLLPVLALVGASVAIDGAGEKVCPSTCVRTNAVGPRVPFWESGVAVTSGLVPMGKVGAAIGMGSPATCMGAGVGSCAKVVVALHANSTIVHVLKKERGEDIMV